MHCKTTDILQKWNQNDLEVIAIRVLHLITNKDIILDFAVRNGRMVILQHSRCTPRQRKWRQIQTNVHCRISHSRANLNGLTLPWHTTYVSQTT